MDPPNPKATIRISTYMGVASQYANSSINVIELRQPEDKAPLEKGKTPQEKGEYYLQLSLDALRELDELSKDERLSKSERAVYEDAYDSGLARYDDARELRDQILTQKKSFHGFLLNLFVRRSANRFYKISYKNYSAIRRTSEDIKRRLMPDRRAIFRSLEDNSVSISEENPRDVVEGHISAADLPPNGTIQGFSLDVNSEEEVAEVVGILNRLPTSGETTPDDNHDNNNDDDDDDSATVRLSTQSRPPSPSVGVTIIYNINNISNSVLSVNSEVTGAAIISPLGDGSE